MRTLSVRKLAETITRLREEKNLTQEELGNLTGINRIMIGRIEREDFIPSIIQLEALGNVLGFNVIDMFVEKEVALRNYDMYGIPLKSEVDEKFQEGSLIKGEFYNLPGYAIFEAGKNGYIGSNGKDWRSDCDNNWAGPENFIPATPLEKKWVITCRKQDKLKNLN